MKEAWNMNIIYTEGGIECYEFMAAMEILHVCGARQYYPQSNI